MQNGPPPHETPTGDRQDGKLTLWDRCTRQFHMRPPEDDEPQSWWIASTAIPLVAAAAGPLANVMSIVALVMPWRSHITSRTTSPAGNWYQEGYADPHWYVLDLSGSVWWLLTIYIAGSRPLTQFRFSVVLLAIFFCY